jgi:hypothetical protein
MIYGPQRCLFSWAPRLHCDCDCDCDCDC